MGAKALNDFIAYKGRCSQRLQHVERNCDAQRDAGRLKHYLTEFPRKDRSNNHCSLPFSPLDVSPNPHVERGHSDVADNIEEENREITVVDQIVAMLPNVDG